MKKRIMGIVLAAVMLSAVLAGCGNSTAAPAASTAPSAAPEAAESAAAQHLRLRGTDEKRFGQARGYSSVCGTDLF